MAASTAHGALARLGALEQHGRVRIERGRAQCVYDAPHQLHAGNDAVESLVA